MERKYHLWKIRYKRVSNPMFPHYVMYHGDERIAEVMKHDGLWILIVNGYESVQGFGTRRACSAYTLEVLNGPWNWVGTKSHPEFSDDGREWHTVKTDASQYMRWVQVTVPMKFTKQEDKDE